MRLRTGEVLFHPALRTNAARVLLVAGRESHGTPAHEVTLQLAARLGREVIELPGGHLGSMSKPAEFAHALLDALAETGSGTAESGTPAGP
jgi:pimeloyl-ACP methyl ester carboxylesterase